MLTDFVEAIGFHGEVVLALSVGLIAWYLIRMLSFGKSAGSLVDTGVKMFAFAVVFLAAGIALDWWDPVFSKLFDDLWTAIGALFDWVPRLIDRASEVVGIP